MLVGGSLQFFGWASDPLSALGVRATIKHVCLYYNFEKETTVLFIQVPTVLFKNCIKVTITKDFTFKIYQLLRSPIEQL